MKIAPIGTKIPPTKCGCGIVHDELPAVGKVNGMGLWFDCPSCGSTLLIMSKENRERIDAAKKARLERMG